MSTAKRSSADLKLRVSVNPHVLSGKPVVRGTRIPISLILNLLGNGYSIEQIIDAYPTLTEDDIRGALLYASAAFDDDEAVLDALFA
jgi:uncharacterized protein (DUF433 family)